MQSAVTTYLKKAWPKTTTVIPVTGCRALQGCEMLKIPHCLDNPPTDGGKANLSQYLLFFLFGVEMNRVHYYWGHCWPIVPALDDVWGWVWSSLCNEWQGKPKYSEKTCPSAALSTTNPTWPDPGWNPGRRWLTAWATARPKQYQDLKLITNAPFRSFLKQRP
jgi:hypothetical protein